jgi:hypothetical protein
MSLQVKRLASEVTLIVVIRRRIDSNSGVRLHTGRMYFVRQPIDCQHVNNDVEAKLKKKTNHWVVPCHKFEGLRFCCKLARFVRRILWGPRTPSV